jgi:hypothetical protein
MEAEPTPPSLKTDLPTYIQRGPVPDEDMTNNQLDPGDTTAAQWDTVAQFVAASSQSEEELDEIMRELPQMSIDQWLEKLKGADRAFYNTMAMEVWSIAKSMDNLQPGFWTRFMVNRREAMKQFVKKGRGPKLEDMAEDPTGELLGQPQPDEDITKPQ